MCEGIYIGKAFFEEKENRLLTLLLKGLTVYLLTMGRIGLYLSAFNINFNSALCHVIIFVMAMLCAMLYYRLLTENLGYLILFLSFAWLVITFRTYINSGFYAVVNITVEIAAQYFDVNVQRLYTEQIENRYLTVTMFVIFLGIVLDIFLNVYISRRMQYVTVFFVVMFLNVVPLYFIYEPNVLYALMLLAGMAMAYVFKSGKHYSPQIAVKRYSNKYTVKMVGIGKKKTETIDYVYDIRSMLQAGLMAFVFVLLMIIGIRSVRPVDSFNTGYTGNKYKELSMAGLSVFMTDGFSGFRRYTNDTGGLDSGKLGTVSTVRIDNQTDVIIQFTPYSMDTVYLKYFVGERYNPYENTWTSIYDTRGYNETAPEAEAYKAYYEENGLNSSKGIMMQNTIDAYGMAYLPPYYTTEAEDEKNGFFAVTYYPYIEGNGVYVDESCYNGEPYTENDLYVPEENRVAVDEFLEELGWIGTDEQNIQAVIDYFQDNIPYTIKPGKTPKKKDFVNYFLQENMKGYCSHFASAAVLIFRAMGIPARYVEGYAVSYNDIMLNGEIIEDKDYNDYYDGYSLLGETAMVQVNVTDANAHAWVEVYEAGKGWHVVDVTPAGSVEETDEEFWDMFDRIVNPQTDGTGEGNDDGQGAGFNISDRTLKQIGLIMLGIIIAGFVLFMILKGYRMLLIYIRYMQSGNSDKLIMKYSQMCERLTKRAKRMKCTEFGNCHNYHTQLEYIEKRYAASGYEAPWGEKLADIEDIIERAGFSGREITDEELNTVIAWLKSLNVRIIIQSSNSV